MLSWKCRVLCGLTSLFARTVGQLMKNTGNSSNFFFAAKRTLIHASSSSSTSLSPLSASPASVGLQKRSIAHADFIPMLTIANTNKLSPAVNGVLEEFDATFDFPKMEEKVLQMWKEKDSFRKALKLSQGRKLYSFYDGPPFATGLPHYGHILAGTIKDIVVRFAYQTGHHVYPRFGWDCHGLPIEFEIDKQLGIKTTHDVLKYGIDNYNEECRKIVMRYAMEWRKTVERVGRWIDFDNDYKTMSKTYMESVWWVFGELWKKGLIYRGFRVMPYSTGCTTPLSNFEANLNYKDVSDTCVTVAFESRDEPNTYYLAWTTTPWTLPSNLALCVNEEVNYIRILDKKSGRNYYVAKERLGELYPTKKGSKASDTATNQFYEVVAEMKGAGLVGGKYKPIFPYFDTQELRAMAFRILSADYVTTGSGTGIVHQAPGFGEEDYNCCLANGVIQKDGNLVSPVDMNGCFTDEVVDYAGRYVKDCDADIIKALEKKGLLFHKGSIVHSYPFCWRSETPLLYKAVDSWFVNVESFRDRLVAANDATYWVPEFVKSRRFGNWLADARDWNISRNRYWGTPLPIWHSEDWEEVVVVSSIAELERLSGTTDINDIHRHFIDKITIPSTRPGVDPLRRVPMVFDCWFESGSMPYAQEHYPFENQDLFKEMFPTDFVAEGLDQTRGWFYTLLVLGVALFDTCPFKNVCVSGLILAEDGKKMSKRLKNYPEPMDIINKCSADALRMYIISSPVVRGEPLRFRESGVRGVVKDILLPLFNAARFFIANANYCIAAGGEVSLAIRSTNEMDRWILTSTETLVRYVRYEMSLYHLYNVVPGILRFVMDLSNWYVRMNRRRMKNSIDLEDRSNALSTMFSVLFTTSRVIAHIAPFVAEILYQRIRPLLPEQHQADSIHHLLIPEEDRTLSDPDLERAMARLITIVDLVRVLRDRMVIPMKRPVRQLIVVHPEQSYLDDVAKVATYIREEVNALEVKLSLGTDYIETRLDVNFEVLGKRFRKEMPTIRKAVQAMTPAQVTEFIKNKGGEVNGYHLDSDDVKVLRTFKEGITYFESNTDTDVVVLVDKREDQELINSWRAREFVNRVQQLRKKANLVASDQVDVYFECEEEDLTNSILKCSAQVSQTIPGLWTTMDKMTNNVCLIAEEDNSISGVGIHLVLTAPLKKQVEMEGKERERERK